ncbi:MAG: DUF1501 domain-containing protein [Planctomycetota bacterium]|nr:DUF1501 domain-containing protein [Planctomycetota bacterium]
MQLSDRLLLQQTRRHFFQQCGAGVGKIALGSLLFQDHLAAAELLPNPLAPKRPHFTPRVKNVIYLFMAGGPSQLDLFDYKPKLAELNDKPIPESFLKNKRFAFMDSFTKEPPKLLATRRKFSQHQQSGTWISDCLPHMSSIADDLAVIKTVATDNFNHAPAKVFVNTGSTRFGRPSMGAWINYGLGNESQNLPGFVVLQSGPRGPRGGAPNWASGMLPTSYQGVVFRNVGDPVLNLTSPEGISQDRQRASLDLLRNLNLQRLQSTGDAEIATRIASYEMAYRMQSSAPDLIDLSRETQHTLESYGAKPGKASFSNNCLLARRLVERGVRFVQLYHTDWDHHGGPGSDLEGALDQVTTEIDQPIAALIKDLKSRGLFDQTLIVWGGEFGRTPMGENRETIGRNHHIDSFTMWMAGAGIKAGQSIGNTDELGFSPEERPVHIHDIQATILHLMGLNHLQLSVRDQGLDVRLTGTSGTVIPELLA